MLATYVAMSIIIIMTYIKGIKLLLNKKNIPRTVRTSVVVDCKYPQNDVFSTSVTNKMMTWIKWKELNGFI